MVTRTYNDRNSVQSIKAAEKRILFTLLDQYSQQTPPLHRAELRGRTGDSIVLFEAALQNLLSNNFVQVDPRSGITLNRKGLLYAFSTRELS